MAIFTISELDAISDEIIHELDINAPIRVDLLLGQEQREIIIEAHANWVATLDSDVRESADWTSPSRSNFDLYSELRVNGVDFQRLPGATEFTVEEIDAMDDDTVYALANKGDIDLRMDDSRRDSLLRARADWIETLDDDIRDAFLTPEEELTNWDLYSEVRINGIPVANEIVHAPSMAM